MSPFDAAIAAASAASPIGGNAVPVPRRVLLVDGDGLAYYCAGNDDTDAGEARANLISKVKSAQRACNAERVVILLTSSGSHKGHRYAIARVKPYQGQRVNSRRPKNWQHLRECMEAGGTFPFDIQATAVAEADDLFGMWAYDQPENVVICTQDKDMRMLPGMHLDWVTHRTHKVACQDHDGVLTVFNSEFNDKQYGPKWFWLQMLHGDTADNIPGLPKYVVDGKAKPCGEVTAGKFLADEQLPHLRVAELYRSYYGDRWLVEMMEQACLLWMRREPVRWDDCMVEGHGPLDTFRRWHEFEQAYNEIKGRVDDADNINAKALEGE